MIENALGFVLILIGLGAVTLQRLYSAVPLRELKRLASRGDSLATSLYRAVAYGASLRLLLWITVAVTLPVGLLLTTRGFMVAISLAILFVTAVLGFVILPSMQLTQGSAKIAARVAPLMAWMLLHTHSLLDRVAHTANRFRELPRHSRLYEKEDLLELLQRQRSQADNRINEADLDLMERTLTFEETRAADLVQPRKEVHLVNADDSIGPVLLNQLHKQKQRSFLVYKDGAENIIGSLVMGDAVSAKQGGRVFDLIRSDLIYVNEDFSARQVLTAFHRTGHQLAVVINNAEEFVGVITLDHVLSRLLGEGELPDDDVAYGDRSVVAAYTPKKPEPEVLGATDGQTAHASPEATEVIE